ncbi:MAG: transporter substrate-binding domain-containing protein [Verrucomicrobiota bacterium]
MRLKGITALLGLTLFFTCVLGANPDRPVVPSPFKAKPLRVGVTADSPPLAFKIDGELEGVEIDLARLLGKELGRPIVFVEVAWADQIKFLNDDKTDIIMSGMTVTREREELVAFSPPYLNFGQMSLVRKQDRPRFTSVRSLLDTASRVAVVPDTTGAAFVKNDFANADIVEFATPEDAVDAVVRSQADIFVYDSPVINWMAGKREMENVVPVNINLTIEYLAWAMRKSDSKLQDQVANALFEFESDGRLQTVLGRWISDQR